MDINILSLSNGAKIAKGITVIIDVYRAFTTQSFAFENGIKEILNVSEIEQALNMREKGFADYCMGEIGGIRPDNFDFGNSPFDLKEKDEFLIYLDDYKKALLEELNKVSNKIFIEKETAKIITSAQCEMCKERILEEMQFTKGVTAVDLDVESQLLTITFKSKKTNLEKIKRAISLIGYDADEIIADKKAHDKLPKCCQNPDFGKPKKE